MSKITDLMDHYQKGVQDNEQRLTRKNGWNQLIRAYLNVLPIDWPYEVKVTDPRIRTTLLEKTGRLLNSKLQGYLVPREQGDVMGAAIHNSIVEYQWDNATRGGSMLEKLSSCDQITRIFGAAFVYSYWDKEKECNEIKVLDPRDVFVDFTATHVRGAKWVQIREYSTVEKLKKLGFKVDLKKFKANDRRDNNYVSAVRESRGLEDRTGEDKANPVLEVVTEWSDDREIVFLPRYKAILRDRENPYKHKKIPVSQLRYYPIVDDVIGESEIEPVVGLNRAINAVLCGFLEQMNLSLRPPIKIRSNAARLETIVYGPGAQWLVNSPDAATPVENIGRSAIEAFNNAYPALVAAFNNAMGDQSLGISNIKGYQTDKTATEVSNLEKQQNNRDQYNQLFLGEFLKDIMQMWVSNNQQYLFSNPDMQYKIIKIVGREKIQEYQKLKADEASIPKDAMSQLGEMISSNPGASNGLDLEGMMKELEVPKNAVVVGTDEYGNPSDVRKRLTVGNGGDVAELIFKEEDLDGIYDYIPDVRSMAAGAGRQLQQARQQAFNLVLNPQVQQMLAQRGKTMDISDLIVNMLEDNGLKDAEKLFDEQPLAGNQGVVQPGINPGVPGGITANPTIPSPGGVPPEAQGVQGVPPF